MSQKGVVTTCPLYSEGELVEGSNQVDIVRYVRWLDSSQAQNDNTSYRI